MLGGAAAWNVLLKTKPAKQPCQKAFVSARGLAYTTFRKYCKESTLKLAGRPPLLPLQTQKVVAETLVYKDRTNLGVGRVQAAEAISTHGITQEQAAKALRTVRKNFKNHLTKRAVITQASTTKRAGQPSRENLETWHNLIDAVDKECTNSADADYEKNFHNFCLNIDETNIGATEGVVRIIDDKQKKKHESESANSRTSITILRVDFSSSHFLISEAYLSVFVFCFCAHSDELPFRGSGYAQRVLNRTEGPQEFTPVDTLFQKGTFSQTGIILFGDSF